VATTRAALVGSDMHQNRLSAAALSQDIL